jgi:hypothetical protein
MFEPVWLGNYIVPRWEAVALVVGSIGAFVVVAVIACGLVYCGLAFLVKRMNGYGGKR